MDPADRARRQYPSAAHALDHVRSGDAGHSLDQPAIPAGHAIVGNRKGWGHQLGNESRVRAGIGEAIVPEVAQRGDYRAAQARWALRSSAERMRTNRPARSSYNTTVLM